MEKELYGYYKGIFRAHKVKIIETKKSMIEELNQYVIQFESGKTKIVWGHEVIKIID